MVDDKPQKAPPASEEERQKILDAIAEQLPPSRQVVMDGQKKRGTKQDEPKPE